MIYRQCRIQGLPDFRSRASSFLRWAPALLRHRLDDSSEEESDTAAAMRSSFLISALVAAFWCGPMHSEASSSQHVAAPPSQCITVAIPGPRRAFLRIAGLV